MMWSRPEWVEKLLKLDENCRPKWGPMELSPFCDETCPAFNGKRCELLGHRPAQHCEPAVIKMGEALRTISDRVHSDPVRAAESAETDWMVRQSHFLANPAHTCRGCVNCSYVSRICRECGRDPGAQMDEGRADRLANGH